MSQNNNPLVSVLLPVGSNRQFLKEAVESIEGQSYRNIELLIGDDKQNEGIAKILNRLANKAKGKYLARMDADDVSKPDRIAKQVEYLEKNQRVKLVGSWADLIDESGVIIGDQLGSATWNEIKTKMFDSNPLIHPSWMTRKKWFLESGGYNEEFMVGQDWEFLARNVWSSRMENLPERLIKLRIHEGSVSFQKNREQVINNIRIRWGMIKAGRVPAWKFIYLLENLMSIVIPVSWKLRWRKQKKYYKRDDRLEDNTKLKKNGGKIEVVLGIVLPMGQNKKLLMKSGQWSLWGSELEFYRQEFSRVELFEYRYSDWRRFGEALLMPFVDYRRFKQCVVLKAVHLTGAIPCLVAKLLFRTSYVLSYGYRYDEFARLEGKLGQRLLVTILTPIAVRFADAVMVPTVMLSKHVLKFGAKRVEIIPNGVNIRRFATKLKVKSQKSKVTVLYVGRLEKQKNPAGLIQAIADLNQFVNKQGTCRIDLQKRIELVFVGAGSLRQELLELARKLKISLEIKTPIANDKLPEIYRSADIFVLPSLAEGHPKALLEAMSCELACLASNIEGINEIITDGRNGTLVEPTRTGINKGLKLLISDRQLRDKLGSRARKTVENRYDKKILMKQEIEILKLVSK